MKFLQIITFIVTVILFQSCAQISAPTGGPEDITPPQLDSAGTFPANYSTLFSGDKIILSFDEYFVLKNPTANVFFSPSLEEDPEFLTAGKTLTILLKNKLKENTTYTINFGDAISDFNMGNQIPDFKYVFSTGDFLDSMATSGTVLDAYTGEPKEDIFVMLYEDLSDSVVTNSKPVYYAKTNKEGLFNINYIKAGTYKMAALEDKNRNFKYDLPNELIGSIESPLNLKDTNFLNDIAISVFERDHEKQRINSKLYTFPGKLSLEFQRSADTVLVMDKDGKPLTYHSLEYSKNRDSLIVWKPQIENIKNELKIRLDTTNKVYNIYSYVKPRTDTALTVVSITKSIEKLSPVIITFDRPLAHLNTDLIGMFQDSTLVRLDGHKIEGRKLFLFFKKEEGLNYKYNFLPNAFEDIFGYKNSDTLTNFISIRKSDSYGIFSLKLVAKDASSYLIQLMNEKGDLLSEQKTNGSGTVSFEKLEPGKYKVKAIQDKNKNGKWDTGDYYKKLKPEQVYFLNVPIEIRSNWEVVETWEL